MEQRQNLKQHSAAHQIYHPLSTTPYPPLFIQPCICGFVCVGLENLYKQFSTNGRAQRERTTISSEPNGSRRLCHIVYRDVGSPNIYGYCVSLYINIQGARGLWGGLTGTTTTRVMSLGFVVWRVREEERGRAHDETNGLQKK